MTEAVYAAKHVCIEYQVKTFDNFGNGLQKFYEKCYNINKSHMTFAKERL